MCGQPKLLPTSRFCNQGVGGSDPSAGILRYGTSHQHRWLHFVGCPPAAIFTWLEPELPKQFTQRQPGPIEGH
jgi:hypothetical protein